MSNVHKPVLLNEVIEYLNPQPGQKFVDGTLGGGGYTLELLKAGAEVLAIDLDPVAINNFQTSDKAEKYKNNLILVQDNFANIKQICYERAFNKINGIVLDLGLSSNQLADEERGFSFRSTGSLDMRFDPEKDSLTAFEIINNYSQEKLSEIFYQLGEETLARQISKIIHEKRRQAKISSPAQLANIVEEVYAKHFKTKSKVHPATKVFQALRMEVNHELDNLRAVLPDAAELLTSGGRTAIVSFHSLEDRIVKHYFKDETINCVCPPEIPECRCGHTASLKIITKKPVMANDEELENNPRARSAKLRVAEKL